MSLLTSLSTLLVGCSSLAVSLGLRVRLDQVPVTSVSISLVDRHGDPVAALGPGQSARLVVVANASDGKQYASVGAGHGKVAMYNYTIAAAVVIMDKHDSVSLSPDPRASDGKVGHLHAVPVAHRNIAADMDIPIRYDIAYSADFSGADGLNGSDGLPGIDGSAGADGTPPTTDPATGAVTSQGPGGNGGDGGNGADGSSGQAVHVWVRMASRTKPLLQVKADGGGQQSYYLVDPNGGSLKVIDNGGQGGRAGQGGRGGRGGGGGSGFPPGFTGSDGRPGFDGRSGFGGAAGTIAISVDPAAQPFLKCISWSNRDGDGRPGSSPTITVEPIAPLW